MELPVKVIHDQFYDVPDFPVELMSEKFEILDIDDTYLIVQNSCFTGSKRHKTTYKAFDGLDAALDWLKTLGIEPADVKRINQDDSPDVYDPRY